MNEDDHIDAVFCGYTDDAVFGGGTPGASEQSEQSEPKAAEPDTAIVGRFRRLGNNDKLRFLQRATAREARAILGADIGMVDGFCRGVAEVQIETLATKARIAAVAQEISARGKE